MKLVYFHDPAGNFGDDLNLWLWPRLLPGLFTGQARHGSEYQAQNESEDCLFYGMGTILDQRIAKRPRKIIFGVGTGYFSAPKLDSSYEVYFVRGPLTAKALGLDAELGISDPAIMLRTQLERPKARFPVSLIMHCDTAKSGHWQHLCDELGIHHIDPRGHDPIAVIESILASELVITESLHGAIVADTYDIPWVAVNSMPYINRFKWDDWCATLDLSYQPRNLHALYDLQGLNLAKRMIQRGKYQLARQQLKQLLRNPQPILSKRPLVSTNIDRIQTKIAALLRAERSD